MTITPGVSLLVSVTFSFSAPARSYLSWLVVQLAVWFGRPCPNKPDCATKYAPTFSCIKLKARPASPWAGCLSKVTLRTSPPCVSNSTSRKSVFTRIRFPIFGAAATAGAPTGVAVAGTPLPSGTVAPGTLDGSLSAPPPGSAADCVCATG